MELIPETYQDLLLVLVTSGIEINNLCLSWVGTHEALVEFKETLRNELNNKDGILKGLERDSIASSLSSYLYTSNYKYNFAQVASFCNWLGVYHW